MSHVMAARLCVLDQDAKVEIKKPAFGRLFFSYMSLNRDWLWVLHP
jgi:hypothetical protein